jgi:hypothetical protein
VEGQSLSGSPQLPLSDGMILTGATIVDETYAGSSAIRGYFTDTMFRRCTFVQCSLRRCDFEAVIFEQCSFLDCDFGSSDFRSTDFIECTLVRGNFPNGSTKGCKYVGCVLQECRFYRQSFEQNTLIKCSLSKCTFHRSTVLHLEFDHCTFVETKLSDCTWLYHIFDECQFEKSSINADSVALTFGLTRENLDSLSLVWQGKRQQKSRDVDQLLQELIDTFMLHGWAIPACILALNFSLTGRLAALEAVFSALWRNVLAGRPVRLDELQFLTRVLDLISEQGKMPFLAVVRGLDFCARVAEYDRGREETVFRPLAFTLKDAEFRAILAWENLWQLVQGPLDEVHDVAFVFDEAPSVSLVAILQELHGASSPGDRTPALVSTRSGSYIEIVCLTLGTLMAFNLALGMLVQTTGYLITLRNKGRELLAPRATALTRKRALEPAPAPSTQLGRQIALMLGLLSGGSLPLLLGSADSLVKGLREIRLPGGVAPPPTP